MGTVRTCGFRMIRLLCIFSLIALSFSQAQLKSKEGFRTTDDDLVHWGNGQFDIARTPNVEAGKSLTLKATVSLPTSDTWGACVWETPTGDIWYVGAEVVDEEGNPVAGVEPLDTTEDGCGIEVAEVGVDLLGSWQCLYASDTSVVLVISTFDFVDGLRLPETLIPKHTMLNWSQILSLRETIMHGQEKLACLYKLLRLILMISLSTLMGSHSLESQSLKFLERKRFQWKLNLLVWTFRELSLTLCRLIERSTKPVQCMKSMSNIWQTRPEARTSAMVSTTGCAVTLLEMKTSAGTPSLSQQMPGMPSPA